MKPEVSSAELGLQMKMATSIGCFLKEHMGHFLKQSLHDHLNELLAKKGLIIADVARGACLERKYVYQIFNGKKNPSRDKLIAIAFGLGLDEEETQRMLKVSRNKELYVRDERDAVILFALQRGKSLMETNELLDTYGFKLLGSVE